MKITTRGRYAMRAIVELAGSGDDPRTRQDIAEAQNIPMEYLEQLLLQLKREGIVTSKRGPGGGFLLAVDPEELSTWRILKAVHECNISSHCDTPTACQRLDSCIVRYLWRHIQTTMEEELSKITVATLLAMRDDPSVNLLE